VCFGSPVWLFAGRSRPVIPVRSAPTKRADSGGYIVAGVTPRSRGAARS
jgi:hypothetical protein